MPRPLRTNPGSFFTAEELRRYIAERRYPGYTHQRIADLLSLSAGFVGMVLSGARPPSKKFLDAAGFEKVTLYRQKQKPGRRYH